MHAEQLKKISDHLARLDVFITQAEALADVMIEVSRTCKTYQAQLTQFRVALLADVAGNRELLDKTLDRIINQAEGEIS